MKKRLQKLRVTIIKADTALPLLTSRREITITGRRNCETLRALIEAGPRGTSSLEHWAVGKRLSHYIYRLRGFGLDIETQDVQTGDGVRYGRYVLHGDVQIKDDGADTESRAA